MSKERARLRAQREAQRAEVEQAARERERREQRRREWRRALAGRLRPKVRRRAWLLARRSPGQRALIAGFGIAVAWLIWYLVPSWPLRIGFSLLLALVLPIMVIVAFDRRA